MKFNPLFKTILLSIVLSSVWPNSAQAEYGLSIFRIRAQFVSGFKTATATLEGGLLCGVALANAGLTLPSEKSIEQYEALMPALEAVTTGKFTAPEVKVLFDKMPASTQVAINQDGRGIERIASFLSNWEQGFSSPNAPDLPIDTFNTWLIHSLNR